MITVNVHNAIATASSDVTQSGKAFGMVRFTTTSGDTATVFCNTAEDARAFAAVFEAAAAELQVLELEQFIMDAWGVI